MLDYEEQRKLIIIFILAAILTIIIAIGMLVLIWWPNVEVETEKIFEVGKVDVQTHTEQEVIQKYYKQLYVMFINNDLDAIYDLVSEDYLEYFRYDKQDIIEMLREKNVLTRGLELAQYKSFMIDGYSSVYELDLKVKNEAYSINIIIKEESPNNYTIAFDKFIDYKTNTYSETKDSIKLDIYQLIRYTNSIQYEMKLTNGYNKDVKINSGGSGNPIILVNNKNETRRAIMTTLSTAEITMEPEENRTFTAVFNIEDTYDFITYNLLVIKDIQFEGMQGKNNLEFTLW